MIRWFKLLFLKGQIWRVTTEPSLYYSGDWADPKLWGQRHYFSSFWRAWSFAHKYLSTHRFGKADINFKSRTTLSASSTRCGLS